MSAYTHLRAGTVSHCTVAVLMQALGNVAEKRAATDRSLPRRFVHGKLLEVFHIDNDGIVLSSDAFGFY
jgi:hypothetical protein